MGEGIRTRQGRTGQAALSFPAPDRSIRSAVYLSGMLCPPLVPMQGKTYFFSSELSLTQIPGLGLLVKTVSVTEGHFRQ